MRICPTCSAYYSSDSMGFCLADGTPLVNVDRGSEKWNEGSRVIEEKAKGLSRQRRILKWRRIVWGGITALILSMAVAKSFTVETTAPPLINGRVTFKGHGLGGVNIMLNGAEATSTTTDENGNYTFSKLRTGGSYTITPNWQSTFTPPSLSFSNLQHNESADFAIEVFKISGHVTSLAGPLPNVKIVVEGPKLSSKTTETDPDGYYTFSDLPAGGSYTVAPQAELKFKPPSHSVPNLQHDEPVDFAVEVFKISGHVMSPAGPLAKIKVLLEGSKPPTTRTETTDANGYYAFGDLAAGSSYTVAPQGQLTFKLPSRTVPNLQHDEPVDFAIEVFKISGHVMSPAGPLPNFQISLEGPKLSSKTKETDADGYYAFSDLPAGGSYTITPKGQLNFTESRRTVPNLRRNELRIDFFQRPKCDEHEMNIKALDVVGDSRPGWERMIAGERDAILDKYAHAIKNAGAELGLVDYRINFIRPCEEFAVTATYIWQVFLPGNAIAPPQTKSVPKEERFICEKRGSRWICHKQGGRGVTF